jgi:hypothetical protein
MIKRIYNYIWEVMIEIGEARQERLKRNNYHMWY